ncbi:hypothetical protein CW304_29510 [Bacillus sp. UFRGS-B20]|nr:hypothetical protein CW304_29510 [Bacillus sp. UFRGS-B20]
MIQCDSGFVLVSGVISTIWSNVYPVLLCNAHTYHIIVVAMRLSCILPKLVDLKNFCVSLPCHPPHIILFL